MSVRHALLAILDQGPCYGYQLRAEYARRTGVAVNVGQIYTTLERLERDGLVDNRGADDRGHVYWGITGAGRALAVRWVAEPDAPSGAAELERKIALVATLPGVDARAVIATQRDAAILRLAQMQRGRGESEEETVSSVAATILRAAESARTRAEIEWLDAAADAVSVDPVVRTFPLSAERPKRGRPRADSGQAG